MEWPHHGSRMQGCHPPACARRTQVRWERCGQHATPGVLLHESCARGHESTAAARWLQRGSPPCHGVAINQLDPLGLAARCSYVHMCHVKPQVHVPCVSTHPAEMLVMLRNLYQKCRLVHADLSGGCHCCRPAPVIAAARHGMDAAVCRAMSRRKPLPMAAWHDMTACQGALCHLAMPAQGPRPARHELPCAALHALPCVMGCHGMPCSAMPRHARPGHECAGHAMHRSWAPNAKAPSHPTPRQLPPLLLLFYPFPAEYNVLVHNNELYCIDVSQAVELDHPRAFDFLREGQPLSCII